MPGREGGVAKRFQGDPPQRDVDPEIVVAGLECISQRVASLLGIAGLPDLHALLIVELGFFNASRMDQLERSRRARNLCHRDGTRTGG